MAKIQRAKQEIFASQSGSKQITAFGTAKNDTPVYTQDVNQIQNTNYLYGWSPALLPDKAPYEEDMNALFYAITKQLAYLFQEGIPEYDANTEYSKNALVRGVNSNIIYCSNQDNNLGNSPDDPNYWAVYNTGGNLAAYEIGLPQPTLRTFLFPNEIWLEGQIVSRTTYKKLFDIYGTTYGEGDGSTTFVLPDCRNRVFWGSETFGYLDAGLPNITGQFRHGSGYGWQLSGAMYFINQNSSGYMNRIDGGSDSNYTSIQAGFDASRSSAVYGKSDTVQPPAIKARFKTRYY